MNSKDLLQEEPKNIYARPARFGDICVLLEPTQKEEIKLLRQRQTPLQSLFGGILIEDVHLTCQRFACQDKHLMQGFVQNLTRALAIVEPFPFTALSLKMLYSPLRQTNILKWHVQVTENLQRFVAIVEHTLLATDITPLYPSGFVSSLVAALRGVPELNSNNLSDHNVFPHHLFAADKVVLSKINGLNEFETLATFRLPALAQPIP
ncbi:MAG: hypothetical protein ACE5LU_14150 [Anaerolineae bacterium]